MLPLNKSYRICLILLLFLFITFLLPFLPGPDNMYWIPWTSNLFSRGLRNAYSGSGDNYLPLYQYFLWFLAKISGSETAIVQNISYLRCFTLFFEMLSLWYVYKWIDKKADLLLLVFFNILNIAFSYNTILWGQVDGMLSALVFISLYYGQKESPVLSAIWFILALNFKLQTIIFLPLWGLLFLNNIIYSPKLKTIFFPLLALITLQILLVIPFSWSTNGLHDLYEVVFGKGSVDCFPVISMGARNMWVFLVHGNLSKTPDSGILFGNITYKKAGILLFLIFSFFALLPVIKEVLKNIKKARIEKSLIDKQCLWLVSALIPLLFFYFNTQMHERYCHPAFIFIIAYTFYTKDFTAYILFSLAYFLNLEILLKAMHLYNYNTFIFKPEVISALFAITIVYLFVKLYKLPSAKKHQIHNLSNE
jgi:Gpi18-like mannosyltransferase